MRRSLFFLSLMLLAGNACHADSPLTPTPTESRPSPEMAPVAPVEGAPWDSASPDTAKLMPYGVATLSVCNNRVNPANAAEMATQMLLGTPVEILGRERSYYQVRTPEGYVSWTEGAGIQLMEADAFSKWQNAPKVIVTSEYTHSYAEPSAKSTRVSDLVAGDILELQGKTRGFYKVGYPDGRVAYLQAKEAKNFKQWSAQNNPDANQILRVAKTMMGVPYLWGGTSLKGVDCSGFTKTSFFLNGIVIPRDASQQAVVGEEVDILENGAASLGKCLKNLQAGDLLFFGSNRGGTATPRVSHTAIYIGNGEFIQAAGLVRINSMVPTAPNYSDSGRRRLVGARRFLTAIGTPGITRVDSHPAYRAKS